MQELLKALVAAKLEFTPIAKDKVNPHYKNKYSSLDAVLGGVEPALCKHGLAIVHHCEDDKFITTLYHESGQSMSSTLPLPQLQDPQKLGSYLTYCRRYALSGLLSVCSDEDDDGHRSKPGIKQADATALVTTAREQKTAKLMPSDRLAELKDKAREGFKILGWNQEQILEWADINFGGHQFDNWDAENWRRANTALSILIDQDVAS